MLGRRSGVDVGRDGRVASGGEMRRLRPARWAVWALLVSMWPGLAIAGTIQYSSIDKTAESKVSGPISSEEDSVSLSGPGLFDETVNITVGLYSAAATLSTSVFSGTGFSFAGGGTILVDPSASAFNQTTAIANSEVLVVFVLSETMTVRVEMEWAIAELGSGGMGAGGSLGVLGSPVDILNFGAGTVGDFDQNIELTAGSYRVRFRVGGSGAGGIGATPSGNHSATFSGSLSVVPEPSVALLMVVVLGALLMAERRRR